MTDYQPRIYRVIYRSAINGRLVKVFMKVPYSGLYAMTETLTRAVANRQVEWYRLDPAKPGEITPKMRAALKRWPEALGDTVARTGVNWLS